MSTVSNTTTTGSIITTEVVESLTNDSMISVVGFTEPFPYGKIKNAVIYLGGEFYFKDDEINLVKVRDSSGKRKLYRKTSKLIVEISKGVFVHKKNVVYTSDGVPLDKDDPNTILFNGAYTRKEYTVTIDGTLYLKSDPRIVKCVTSSEFILKDDGLLLDTGLYGSGKYAHKKYSNRIVTMKNGNFAFQRDTTTFMDADGELFYVGKHEVKTSEVTQIFYKFKDVTNPQLDRVDLVLMYKKDKKHTEIFDPLGIPVHVKHLAELNRIYNEVILVQMAEKTAQLKAALKYSDDGPDENQATLVKKIPASFPGKSNLYSPSKWGKVESKVFDLTGGLKYTFGLEIETSQGMLASPTAEDLMVRIVGDRSIGAGEYVSPVLEGNQGMIWVERVCRALAACTFVDDRCGIHTHVGGFDNTRAFAIMAIKLGAQIEEELYKSCPESRYPTLKHCHSIKRWADINDTNWRQYLAAYVFGPEENWAKPFNFKDYSYGSGGHSKMDTVDTWCGGRYKWLNLVHMLTRSNFTTCELRIFPGSTNFDKIYNYIMTSMAFVWFVENRPNLIERGNCTLELIFNECFKTHPEIADKLNKFYKARTERFKRGVIYPTEIPKAIF